VVNLLAQSHPVGGLDEASVPELNLRGRAAEDSVDDREKVDLLGGRDLNASQVKGIAACRTRGRELVIVVLIINLLKLAQNDSCGDDAVAVFVVATIVEAAQGWNTLEHILDGSVLAQVAQQLALILDDALGRFELWEAGEMSGGNGEDGV
jgi:hypothetical protein